MWVLYVLVGLELACVFATIAMCIGVMIWAAVDDFRDWRHRRKPDTTTAPDDRSTGE